MTPLYPSGLPKKLTFPSPQPHPFRFHKITLSSRVLIGAGNSHERNKVVNKHTGEMLTLLIIRAMHIKAFGELSFYDY